MGIILADSEISDLLKERKLLPADYKKRIIPKPKRGHDECEFSVTGESGRSFCVLIRKSIQSPLDFSVILAYDPLGTSARVLLRRYNGKSHEHSNVLEREPAFYDFHIHTATERYMRAGLRAEHYAQPTDRYADVQAAFFCLTQDCGFEAPPGDDPLFSGIAGVT
jgi:hypothetical protein